MNRFLTSKIYKITNTDTDDVYIGSSFRELDVRLAEHIIYAYNPKYQHKPICKLIRDKGIVKMKIELIKEFPCSSRKQLENEEAKFIKELGNLNINHNKKKRGNDNSYEIYEEIFEKYFPEKNPYSFSYKTNEKFTDDKIELNDKYYNFILSNSNSKKEKPETKGQLLWLLVLVIKSIFGKEYINKKRLCIRDKDKRYNISIFDICIISQ